MFVNAIGLKSLTVGFFIFGASVVLDISQFGLSSPLSKIYLHDIFRPLIQISLSFIILNNSGFNLSSPGAFPSFSLLICCFMSSSVISTFTVRHGSNEHNPLFLLPGTLAITKSETAAGSLRVL